MTAGPTSREQPLVFRVLHPEPGRRNDEFLVRRQTAAMCDRKEGDAVKVDLSQARLLTECQVGDHMAGLVRGKPYSGACQERGNLFPR